MLGPWHVMATAALHLRFIEQLLAVTDGAARTRVLRVAASFAEFAGWVHQDAGNVETAARWSDQSLEWATEADDEIMISYVLTRKSHQAAGQGNARRTLGLAEAALRERRKVSPRTRALAHRQVARAHAMTRDADACARALDEARREAARTDDHGQAERTLTGYCTPMYVETESAACWMLLGDVGRAIAIYEAVLAKWPTEFERDRGLHVARLATAYAANLEPERACAVATEAITSVSTTGSARAAEELKRLPGWLGRWRNTEKVRVLREAVSAL